MLFDILPEAAAVLPLRAIAFQSMLLLVAIALEAIVLRQRLRLGFQPSVQYAASLNLFATSLGWIFFLLLEPLAPPPLQTQIISYVLFDRFYPNPLFDSRGVFIIVAGMGVFFLTFLVKVKALEWLTRLLGRPVVQPAPLPGTVSLKDKFDQARRNRLQRATPLYAIAVLQANALSFSAILLLLLLRQGLQEVT